MAKTPAKKTSRKKPATPKPAAAPAATFTVTAPEHPAGADKPRRLKKPQYKSFKRHKHIKSEGHTIPSAFKLLRQALAVLARNWLLFLIISLIYGVLNLVLVQGFTVMNLGDSKASLDQVVHGHWSWLINGSSLYASLLDSATTGSGSSDNPGGIVYQTVIQLMFSLVVIWTLRQLYAGKKPSFRDGFYQGMYPLVPFLLVLVVMMLQAIPVVAGSYLYSIVNANEIAASTIEQVLWVTVVVLTALLSLYLICSSVIALYVVSLPNMTPTAALRSARQLVQFRRWAVIRKLIFLPIFVVLIGALIMIPVILVSTAAAPWVFLVLSVFVPPVVHSYLYALYRSLL